MDLSKTQLKHLKAMSHKLKPVVIVGNAGLTDGVLDEIDSSIEHHELIKVRLNASDRDERQSMIDRISKTIHASLINSIGHVAVFYRPATAPVIKLPK